MLLNDKYHGYGVITWDRGKYEGEWKHGKKDGRGVFTWPDGTKYDGEFKDHGMHGYGVLTLTDG
jgi:hypothetical protein